MLQEQVELGVGGAEVLVFVLVEQVGCDEVRVVSSEGESSGERGLFSRGVSGQGIHVHFD